MKDEAVFMACRVLDKQRKKTGVGNFEEQLSKLSTYILKEKIELLGSYLKK